MIKKGLTDKYAVRPCRAGGVRNWRAVPRWQITIRKKVPLEIFPEFIRVYYYFNSKSTNVADGVHPVDERVRCIIETNTTCAVRKDLYLYYSYL